MGRRVITEELQAVGGSQVDTYIDRVVKYIPADVVAAWVAATGIVKGSDLSDTVPILWVAFIFGIGVTAAWTWKQTTVEGEKPAYKQIAISTVAFCVWVFALGGPLFESMSWYHPVFGSLSLIAYTLAVGLLDPT